MRTPQAKCENCSEPLTTTERYCSTRCQEDARLDNLGTTQLLDATTDWRITAFMITAATAIVISIIAITLATIAIIHA